MPSNSTAFRPRPLPRVIHVGFVGKRKLDGVPESDLARALCTALDRVAQDFPASAHFLVGISALAQGSDTVFAETLAGRGVLHQVYLPERPDLFFAPADFSDPDRSRRILNCENVIEVRVVSCNADRRERYAETAMEIASNCTILLVVATAKDIADARSEDPIDFSRGGTAETLRYARQLGRRVYVVIIDAPRRADRMLAWEEWGASKSDNIGAITTAHQGHEDNEEPLFGPPNSALPIGQIHLVEELRGIKLHFSEASRKRKQVFHYLGLWVLGFHAAATLVAAAALSWGATDAMWSATKAVLIGCGLGIALWLHWRRQQTQLGWLRARLAAEICRSTLALAGDPPFPGALRHLRDFRVGGLRDFVATLNVLLLRAGRQAELTRNKAVTANAVRQQFVDRYLKDRVADQIGHYQKKSARACRWLGLLEKAFFVCSFLALTGAVASAMWSHNEDVHPDSGWLPVLKFLALLLPVLAAALVSAIGFSDLEHRAEGYPEMIALLEEAREPLRLATTEEMLRRRVYRLEQALFQENIQWHERMRRQRA